MELTIVPVCFFALILTITAPPVVEKVNKDKPRAASKDNQDSDDVVRRIHFLVFTLLKFILLL